MIALAASAAMMAAPLLAETTTAPAPHPEIQFSQPEQEITLRGGETVEIRWSGIPREAEEIELLLSVDGGRRFSLRLTEELDAHSHSFLWRVPNLIAEKASLAIRIGVGGREITSAHGPVFRLSPDPSLPKVPLRWRSGEIWLDSDDGDDDASGRRSLPVSDLSADPEAMTALPDDAGALDLPRSSYPPPEPAAHKAPDRSLCERVALERIGSPSRVPLSIPQRI